MMNAGCLRVRAMGDPEARMILMQAVWAFFFRVSEIFHNFLKNWRLIFHNSFDGITIRLLGMTRAIDMHENTSTMHAACPSSALENSGITPERHSRYIMNASATMTYGQWEEISLGSRGVVVAPICSFQKSLVPSRKVMPIVYGVDMVR